MPPGIQPYSMLPGVQTINCAVCGNPKSPTNTPLQKCVRCRNIFYCSVACQRSDWPAHKQYCSRPRPVGRQEQRALEDLLTRCAMMNTGDDDEGGMGLRFVPYGEGEEGDDEGEGESSWTTNTIHRPSVPSSSENQQSAIPSPQQQYAAPAGIPVNRSPSTSTTPQPTTNLLHNISEKETFIKLIISFSASVNFDPNAIGVNKGDFLLSEFKRYLVLAEAKDRVLPAWWNAEKRRECEILVESSRRDGLMGEDFLEGIWRNEGAGMLMRLKELGDRIYGRGL